MWHQFVTVSSLSKRLQKKQNLIMSNRSSQIVGILQTMADDFAVPLSCLCKFVGFPVEHGFHGKAHFFARQEDLQKEVDQEKGNKKAYEASGSTSAIC